VCETCSRAQGSDVPFSVINSIPADGGYEYPDAPDSRADRTRSTACALSLALSMLQRYTLYTRWLDRHRGNCNRPWCTEYSLTAPARRAPDNALRENAKKVIVLLTDGLPNRNCQKCGMKHGNRVAPATVHAQRCKALGPYLSTWEDGIPGGQYNPLNDGLSHFGESSRLSAHHSKHRSHVPGPLRASSLLGTDSAACRRQREAICKRHCNARR
jgi:hypothetical protein